MIPTAIWTTSTKSMAVRSIRRRASTWLSATTTRQALATTVALGTSVTIAAAGFRPTTLQYPTTGTDSSRVITDRLRHERQRGRRNQPTRGGCGRQRHGRRPHDRGHPRHDCQSMGDGSITAETYNQPDIGYNLLGTTTIAGVATPNLDQFNRVQNLIWSNYGTMQRPPAMNTSVTAAGRRYSERQRGRCRIQRVYTNDELDQITSLTLGTVSDGAIASRNLYRKLHARGQRGHFQRDRERRRDARPHVQQRRPGAKLRRRKRRKHVRLGDARI